MRTGRPGRDQPSEDVAIDRQRRRLICGLATGMLTTLVGNRAVHASCAIPTRRRLAYDMRVGGVSLGALELRFACNGNAALVEMVLTNKNVAAWIAGRHTTTMTALIGFDENGRPQPTRFTANYQKPDRLRETELHFAPDGALVHLVTRNQGRLQESPVPEELREPSIDPLAALLSLSHWLGNGATPGESVTVPIFEGRKRADLEVVYRGPSRVHLGGRARAAHRLEALVKGLSGFEEGDDFITMPGKSRDWIEVYASADPLPVPLLITDPSRRPPGEIELISG